MDYFVGTYVLCVNTLLYILVGLWIAYSSFLRVWTEQRGCRWPNFLGACSLLKGPLLPSTTQRSGRHTWAGQQLLRTKYIRTLVAHVGVHYTFDICGERTYFNVIPGIITPQKCSWYIYINCTSCFTLLTSLLASSVASAQQWYLVWSSTVVSSLTTVVSSLTTANMQWSRHCCHTAVTNSPLTMVENFC